MAVVVLHREGDTGLGARVEFGNAHSYGGQFESVIASLGARLVYPTLSSSSPDDADAVAEVKREMTKLIEEEGILPERVFVGGFGKGATLALWLAATVPEMGGSFVLDGFEASADLVDALARVPRPPTLLLVCAKTTDHQSLLDALEASRADLDLCCQPAELAPPGTGRQVELAAEWLVARLGRRGEPPPAAQQQQHDPTTQAKPLLRVLPKAVPWRLEKATAQGTVAVFDVPRGSEDLLARFPVTCRGASFAIEKRAPGQVGTTFYSPAPESTAEAIALRIARRFDDPAADGASALCPVS